MYTSVRLQCVRNSRHFKKVNILILTLYIIMYINKTLQKSKCYMMTLAFKCRRKLKINLLFHRRH